MKKFSAICLAAITALSCFACQQYEEPHQEYEFYLNDNDDAATITEKIYRAYGIDLTAGEDPAAAEKIYPGQTEVGDGKIDPNRIGAYVAARYPEYKFYKFFDLPEKSIDYTEQVFTSYFVRKYDNGDILTEGNCALNTMFNVMRHWGRYMPIKMPCTSTVDVNEDIQNDALYATYGTGKLYGEDERGRYRWERNDERFLSKMPTLYRDLRGYALSQGYSVNGYPAEKVGETMEYVANTLYGNSIDVVSTKSPRAVEKSIQQNRACYMSINGSRTYGDHAAAVVAVYAYGRLVVDNANATLYHLKYFYEIVDGKNARTVIFDPNTAATPDVSFHVLEGF